MRFLISLCSLALIGVIGVFPTITTFGFLVFFIKVLQSVGHERESDLEQLAEERARQEKRKQSGRYCDQTHTKNELLEESQGRNLSGWKRREKLKHQRCPLAWGYAGHADRNVECVSAIGASSTRAQWSGARPCYKHERVPL